VSLWGRVHDLVSHRLAADVCGHDFQILTRARNAMMSYVNKSIHNCLGSTPQKFARLKMYSVSREITA
jgi:hypothetical protein